MTEHFVVGCVYKPTPIAYKDFRGSPQEYSIWSHSWEELRGPYDYVKVVGAKKATNPPEVTYVRTTYLTLPIHSSDGWYVIPISFLGGAILSGRQHRELIGISTGA